MYVNDLSIHNLIGEGLCTIPAELADLIKTSEFDRVQPASLELHLHPVVLIQQKDGSFKEQDLRDKPLTLKQGDCAIASTIEIVAIPADMLARVEGKSSIARSFMPVHCTGGFIDPGFKGQITLEIAALGKAPVTLKAGQKIAQLALSQCMLSAWPYGHERRKSKYQNQSGPTAGKPEPEDAT